MSRLARLLLLFGVLALLAGEARIVGQQDCVSLFYLMVGEFIGEGDHRIDRVVAIIHERYRQPRADKDTLVAANALVFLDPGFPQKGIPRD